MRKIILIGHSGSGKTTLTQALKNKKLEYSKTQYVSYNDFVIDTPGEYVETKLLAGALAIYSYESDVVGLLVSATEQYSLFSPNITGQATREVIGIITKIDKPEANVPMVENWLKIAGCDKIFKVSSVTGEGIEELRRYLNKKVRGECI